MWHLAAVSKTKLKFTYFRDFAFHLLLWSLEITISDNSDFDFSISILTIDYSVSFSLYRLGKSNVKLHYSITTYIKEYFNSL